MIPKAQATKKTINKWDHIKLKKHLHKQGDNQHDVKASCDSYNSIAKKKKKKPFKKWAKDLNRHCSKEDI